MATTTRTSAYEVLAAIFAALNVAAMTTTLGCPVYSSVPEPAPLTYLRISTPTGTPWDTFGAAGKQRIVSLDAFTTISQARALQICDKAIQLLQYQPLVIASHVTVGVQYETDGEGAEEVIGGKRVVHHWVHMRVTAQESA